MRYQLVLQMTFATIGDYDDMIRFEDAIAKGLGALGKVDGHDAGSGEMNIFLYTDDPGAIFERIKPLAEGMGLLTTLVAAYRETDGEEYVVVYPPGRTDFAVA